MLLLRLRVQVLVLVLLLPLQERVPLYWIDAGKREEVDMVSVCNIE